MAAPVQGQNLAWSPDGTTPSGGGSGVWDTTGSSWFDGTVFTPWSNLSDDSATFGGSAGTVTLTGPISLLNITFATDGYLLQGGSLNLSNASTIEVSNGLSTIASILAGSGSLIKNGTGTLVLTGSNTYTGVMKINSGTVRVSADNNLGALASALTLDGGTLEGVGSFDIARNVTLGLNGGSFIASGLDALTLSGVISGIGNLTKIGIGTLVLTGVNTYTGTTTLAGTLQVGNGGATGQLGAGNVINNGTLTFNRNNAYTYAGVISGSGALIQNGSGTTTLRGANSYVGGTTINAGSLSVSADNNLGDASGGVILNGGSLTTTANFSSSRAVTLNGGAFNVTGGTFSLSGLVSGGALTKNGGGTLALSNIGNTYLGDALVNAGYLSISDDRNLGAAVNRVVLNNGGGLLTTGSFASSRNLSLTGSSGQLNIGTGTVTWNGLITGSLLVKAGTGTLVLGNTTNSYTGGTQFNSGTLQVSSDAALGALSGGLAFYGGTLQTIADVTSARNVTLGGNGAFYANAGTTLTLNGLIAGTGQLFSTGPGTLILTGANTYTGVTNINSGTLQIASDSNLGTGAINFSGGMLRTTADVTFNRAVTLNNGNGQFNVDAGTTTTLNNPVTGSYSIVKSGNGTLVLAADNTYNGVTNIDAGTVQVGNGGTTGGLGAGGSTNNGALVFNRSGFLTVAPVISGTGSVSLVGPGVIVFSGNNTYKGATTVSGGALYINGVQSGATGLTTVTNGATLGGAGTIGGDVNVGNGATLAPGGNGSAGTLTINGNLALGNSSILAYSLGQSGTPGGTLNDLITVKGNLTLGGTLNVTQTQGGLFDPGVYRVLNYAGLLTDNTLHVGSLPAGFTGSVQTSVDHQVNLIASSNTPLQYWDTTVGNSAVNGGTGVWQGTAGNSNWTDANGVANGPWTTGSFAIFQAAPGTVTVDSSTAGQVTSAGMQFATDGYRLNSGAITLVETTPGSAATTIRVGDGTGAGAAYTATIGSVLQGSTVLKKSDLGTLVLTGTNTYTGGTQIVGGSLQLGDGTTNGSIIGDVGTQSATKLIFDAADGTSLAYSGVISGVGSVSNIGAGTSVLVGNNTYTGGTTLSAGTLQLGDGTTIGSINGNVTNNAVLAFNPTTGSTGTFTGVISGTGKVRQTGQGTTVLVGANIYTGGTEISAGTLQLGDGTTTGSLNGNGTIVGDVLDNGTLALSPAYNTTINLTGTISGSGVVQKIGVGTARLSGNNTYAGDTAINAGTLAVSNDSNLGAASGGLIFDGGTLNTLGTITTQRNVLINVGGGYLNTANGTTLTLGSVIQGVGALGKNGGGTVDLRGLANTYTGGTRIDGGTLKVSSDNNLGAASGMLRFNGGTLNATDNIVTARNIDIGAGSSATFNVDATKTLKLTGVITGGANGGQALRAGWFGKSGDGTLIVTGNNSFQAGFSSGFYLTGGILQVGDGGSTGTLGANSGDDAFNTMRTSAGTTLAFNRNNVFQFNAPITGAGQVQQIGTGTTILGGTSTYTGNTLVSAGTLQVARDANLGATSSTLIIDNATLATTATFDLTHAVALNTGMGTFNVANGTTLTANGVIADGSGTGTLNKTNTGTLVLAASNTYSGGTTINAGTVQVSSDDNLGNALGGLSFNGGTLATTNDFTSGRATTLNALGGTFSVSPVSTFTLGGVISGNGALTKTNLGTLVLSGSNNYSGATTVSGGTLIVNGDQSASTGLTTVAANSTLGGSGTLGGNVTVAANGTLAPGDATGSVGTLTIKGDLTVNSGASLSYTFGQLAGASHNDLINVAGNLAVGGVLNVTTPTAGTFDPGIYRIFNYAGSLTNNGFAIGNVPVATTVTLQMSVPGQINLVNTTGQLLAFWDGSVPTQKNDGSVNGGNGIWNYAVGGAGTNDNWVDANGAANSKYARNSFTIFEGTAGTVTVDNSLGQIRTSGMQFLTDNYLIKGDALTLVETSNGTGSTAIQVNPDVTATIDSVLQGTTQLRKTDLGTLVLNADNTYAGGTALNGGVVQVSQDNNLGDVAGALSFDSGTLHTTGSFATGRNTSLKAGGGTFDVDAGTQLTLNGTVSGAGSLTKTDAGTLVLNTDNTYAGGTALNGGVVQVSRDSNLGDAAGALSFDGGTLHSTGSFASNRSTTLKAGGGTFDVDAGTQLTLNSAVSGTGSLTKTDAGTLVLNSDNTYAGGTALNGGVVQVSRDSNLGDAAGTLSFNSGTLHTTGSFANNRSTTLNAGGGTLDVDAGALLTLNGAIAGTGALTKTDTGTLVLSGANTYAGGTAVTGGVVQVSQDNNLGAAAGTLSLDGATLHSTGSFASNRSTTLKAGGGTFDVDAATLLTQNGAISGAGSLTKTNTGTLVMSGANTYAGGTAVTGGVVQVSQDNNLGDAAGALSLDGATLHSTGSFASNRSTTLKAGGGTFDVDAATLLTLNGAISGAGSLTKTNTGTLVLSGANTYAGGTALNGGVVQVSQDNNLGDVAGALSFDSGTLHTTGSFATGRNTSLKAGGGTFDVDAGTQLTLNGTVSGTGSLTKTDAGTLVLNTDNTYAGGTALNGGVVQVSRDSNLGDAAGALSFDGGTLHSTGSFASNRSTTLKAGGGTFDVDAGTQLTLNSAVSGTGSLTKTDDGTLVLGANNTYSGATTITGGTLQVGTNGMTGSLGLGDVVDNGVLNFNRSNSYSYGGLISGTGDVQQIGSGTTILSGVNTYSGATTVANGTLIVNGDQTGAHGLTTASSGSTLGGGGTLGGNLIVANGATLAPGRVIGGAGTLTVNGDLTVDSGATLAYDLGAANVAGGTYNDLVNVGGNLTVAGTLNVATPAGGSFDPGVYRLFNYAGTLTNNGMTLGTAPVATSYLALQYSIDHQVNLINATGQTLNFWDGQLSSQKNNGVADGGDGVWRSGVGSSTNWTDSNGNANLDYTPDSYAIFQGAAGTVTIDDSQDQVKSSGMQVLTDGYVFDGGPLTLLETTAGSGSTAFQINPNVTTTINAVLQGNIQLRKTNLGTLVLNADNTYAGGTALNGGVVQVSQDNNLGDVAGALSFDSGTLHTTGSFATGRNTSLKAGGGTFDVDAGTQLTLNGTVSGAGSLTKTDAGTLVLNTDNTYAGGTALNGGVVQVSRDSNLGDAAGALSFDGGTLHSTGSFASNRSTTLKAGGGTFDVDAGTQLTLNSAVSGTGSLTKTDDGTLVLGANNTYSGATTITGGTLQVGTNGMTGSLGLGDVVDNGVLNFNRSNSYSYGGLISGTGDVQQIGSGTTILSGVNTYSGATTVANGTLIVNGDQTGAHGLTTASSGSTLGGGGTLGGNLIVANGATLAPGRVIGGAGTLTVNGDLTVDSGATLAYDLGAANVAGGTYNDLVNVGGNLTVAGTLNVATPAGGSFDPGIYRLFNYAGALTDNGLNLGTTPVSQSYLTLQLSQDHQINLINTAGLTLSVWDGQMPVEKDNGVVNGGDGVWNSGPVANTNWTDANGLANAKYTPESYAIFQGAAGTVTVDNSQEQVKTTGMQVLTDGYVFDGGPLTLLETTAGSGSTAFQINPNVTTTINAVLQGDTQLRKTNLGTLVLGADNTYIGGTALNGGVVQVSRDSNLGDAASDLSFDSGTLHTTRSFATDRSTTLKAGGGTFAVDADTQFTLNNTVSGVGSLTKTDDGTLVLGADNTYSGATTITGGTLQVGTNGTTGSLGQGNVVDNGLLAFNRSDVYTYGGAISGTGAVQQVGSGTTVLTGANTYSGTTTVSAGMLRAGAANTFSAASDYTIASNATLDAAGFNQTLASLDNSGTVSLKGATAGTTLTVKGDFIGRDGVLELKTALGETSSATDRLVLEGANDNFIGHTTLRVINSGGLGALTTGDGINLVTALNGATTTAQTNKSAFSLENGHVDAGAYEYRLYAADANGQGEDWFLRSTTDVTSPANPGTPDTPSGSPTQAATYRAEVPLYSALPDVVRQSDLAMLSTLQRRVGGDVTSKTNEGANGNRVWTRAINNQTNIQQNGTTAPHSDVSSQGLQVGIDLWGDSNWTTGVYAGQLNSDASVQGRYGLDLSNHTYAGSQKSDSQYLGVYATYANPQNQYADFVLQYGHHDISSNSVSSAHDNSSGTSATASVEVGQRFALKGRMKDWSIEPQAQLIVNKQNLGSTGISGATTVKQDSANAVIGRVGVRLSGDFSTDIGRLQPYAGVNVWHGVDDKDTTRFNTSAGGSTAIKNGIGYTSTEVSAGFTLGVSKNTSVYAEVGNLMGSGTGQSKVESSVQSSVGIKVSW